MTGLTPSDTPALKFSTVYVRPEMMGIITLDPEPSSIDWLGMVETAGIVAGAGLLVAFGDTQMVISFVAAFVMTLVLAR